MKEEIPPRYYLTELERKMMHAIQDLLLRDGYQTSIDTQRARRVRKIIKRKGK